MNNQEFLKDPTYGYPEVGICMEDTTDEFCKIYIPSMFPFIEHDTPFDKKDNTYSKNNIFSLNKDKLDIYECTESNYISLHLPDGVNESKKGDRFVIGFIRGDISKPFIIGRYY